MSFKLPSVFKRKNSLVHSMRLGALLILMFACLFMVGSVQAQVYITDTQVQNGGVFEVSPPDGEAVVISHTGTDASLTLTNGATTDGVHAVVVGLLNGHQGTLVVNGGSVLSNDAPWWTNSWDFGGDTFYAGSAGIGLMAGSTGFATVSGAGSQWNNSGALSIGHGGTGVLNVLSGGSVTSEYGYLGVYASSNGTVTVDAGSAWTNDWTSWIGYYGTGELNISGGSNVSSFESFVGNYAGSSGVVNVNNSTWTNTAGLHLGSYGSGELNISNGGNVSNSYAYIGVWAGSFGTATVNSSTWTNDGTLYVGYQGIGELNILNGGSVSSTWGILGFSDDGVGTVTVNGSGSNWTMTGELHLGYWGPGIGTLTIEDGGNVSNTYGYISNGSSANVTGAGSSWTNSDDLYVGWNSGSLTVANGGSVSSSNGYIGSASGTGTATLTSGSIWSNNGILVVGNGANGILNIESGSNVSNNDGTVGYFSDGTVNVIGSGSTWNNMGDLYVGYLGNGVLNIKDGGSVVVGSVATIDYGGSVMVDGAGSTLTAISDLFVGYWGSGSLAVNHGGQVDVGGTLYTYSLGTLSGGGGIILGNVENYGTIAPGNSTGILTIDGDLIFGNGSILDIQLGGLIAGTGYDQLVVTGDITQFGSTQLLVSTWDGFNLGYDQTFDFLLVGGNHSVLFYDEFFNALNDGSLVGNLNGIDLFISYHSNGVSLYSAAIPEPSSLLLLGFSLVLGITRRSRRI